MTFLKKRSKKTLTFKVDYIPTCVIDICFVVTKLFMRVSKLVDSHCGLDPQSLDWGIPRQARNDKYAKM